MATQRAGKGAPEEKKNGNVKTEEPSGESAVKSKSSTVHTGCRGG